MPQHMRKQNLISLILINQRLEKLVSRCVVLNLQHAIVAGLLLQVLEVVQVCARLYKLDTEFARLLQLKGYM